MKRRGYCGIGILEPKFPVNLGMLFRSAQFLGADFVFTIGKRFTGRHDADTSNAAAHLPYYLYDDFADFLAHLPQPRREVKLVGVELSDRSVALESFEHPERAIYLLGGEDRTLYPEVLEACDEVVQIQTPHSLNVAVAGSLVLYDRHAKQFNRPAGGTRGKL